LSIKVFTSQLAKLLLIDKAIIEDYTPSILFFFYKNHTPQALINTYGSDYVKLNLDQKWR